CMQALDFPPSF
nr:immunoglobulin light chain junction region [Macaca mulatta]